MAGCWFAFFTGTKGRSLRRLVQSFRIRSIVLGVFDMPLCQLVTVGVTMPTVCKAQCLLCRDSPLFSDLTPLLQVGLYELPEL